MTEATVELLDELDLLLLDDDPLEVIDCAVELLLDDVNDASVDDDELLLLVKLAAVDELELEDEDELELDEVTEANVELLLLLEDEELEELRDVLELLSSSRMTG